MTSKRIPPKQARDLSSQAELAESKEEAVGGENLASIEREGEISFVIGLLLDKERQTRRMRIMHVANGEEETWNEWNERKLLDFIIKRAGACPPPAGAYLPAAAPAEQTPVARMMTEAIPAPLTTPGPGPSPQSAVEARLQAIEIVTSAGRPISQESVPIPVQARAASQNLVANRPFEVHLTLNLTEISASHRGALNYKASIYAKSLQGPRYQTVAEEKGELAPKDSVAVIFKGNPLQKGLYQLQAVVSLSDPASKSKHQTYSIFQTGEKLLRVV